MTRLLVAAVVLLSLLPAAAPAPAAAANHESASDARIAARSGIKTPAATIIQEPCPDMDPKASSEACAYPDGRIYLPVGMDAFARQHELGHLYVDQYFNDGERNRAITLLGLPAGPWDRGTGLGGFDSPSELIPDAYASCRLRMNPDRGWETSYDYYPTRRDLRIMCGFLRRAGR